MGEDSRTGIERSGTSCVEGSGGSWTRREDVEEGGRVTEEKGDGVAGGDGGVGEERGEEGGTGGGGEVV